MISKQNLTYRLSYGLLILYVMVAILASFIAGDVPLICHDNDKISFPVMKSTSKITSYPKAGCVLPLIPYAHQGIDDRYKSAISPFDHRQSGVWRYRHWLGTDKLGRDVAAGMIHGTTIAVKVGFLSVLFSFLIGVGLGLAAGYYQDTSLKAGLISIIGTLIVGTVGFYYLWMELLVFDDQVLLFFAGVLVLIGLIIVINKLLGKFDKSVQRAIPLDTIIVKLIEIRKSFPGVFLLLALVSLFAIPSVWNIVIIITILGWADFARLARGETIAIKNENYIKSARILGFGSIKIIFYHILPNIMPTLIVAICFSISSAVLLESTLSFLGIGLPIEEVSWGKLMAEGRNIRHWWLVVFPGLAIFLLVLALNTVASRWQKSNFTMW
jgi:peptide/nickel transport system permease protein